MKSDDDGRSFFFGSEFSNGIFIVVIEVLKELAKKIGWVNACPYYLYIKIGAEIPSFRLTATVN